MMLCLFSQRKGAPCDACRERRLCQGSVGQRMGSACHGRGLQLVGMPRGAQGLLHQASLLLKEGTQVGGGYVAMCVCLTAFGQTVVGHCWGTAPSPFRCSPPNASISPQAMSPLSAGSQSDYRKVSAAGCSPCESSPASTPLGEQRARAPAEETPATPKGGRGADAACCILPHKPASLAAASQGPLCTSQCILAVLPGASHASLLHSRRLLHLRCICCSLLLHPHHHH